MTAPAKQKGARTLSQMLGASNTISEVPTYTAKRVNVANERASVLKHKYKAAGTTKHGSIELSHTHGEFNKRLKASATGDVEINTHNIATAELGNAPRSFPKILESISTKKGATDALRVLKGTHFDASLRSIYDSHASTKAKRPWEATLGPKATADEKFDAWRAHKFEKWTQRKK
jgi:hypothetical protein